MSPAEMLFLRRREAALALLERSGIWRSNYAPPFTRLLWRLGFRVPPPHFAPFASGAEAGAWFAFAWGLFMWLMLWQASGMSGTVAALSSVAAGILFGVSMGTYYAVSRRRHALPTWESLASASTSA